MTHNDQVTMATMYLSGDAKLWWQTQYEDVLEGRYLFIQRY